MIGASVLRIGRPVSLAVVFGSLLLCSPAMAGDAPALDAARAAKIATDYLARLGPKSPYIVSVILEQAAIVRGKPSWVVRWSRPIDGDGDRELGLRVNFDGTTVRLVEEKSSSGRWRANNINR